jgi:ribonuclease R
VHMYIDGDAKLKSYRFTRGLMKSAARLTYEQVQEAHDGMPGELTAPLMDSVIKPLYKAYSVLKRAREVRGALELDLPERKAIIKEGKLTDIVPRQRLASHQLIEEFMILANVAAALALEDKKAPCVYRIHDKPAYDRLEATREFLKEFGYTLPKGDQLIPSNINHILKASMGREDKDLIHTILLRTQSTAVYSPDNIGHFGLALAKYAHFTSPIRRYADLLVHRSLTRTYKFGEGGMTDDEAQDLKNACEHISFTERRSMIAERDVMDRFTAQYLSVNVGKEFKGRISGVTRFGLFVNLEHSGADGIVPIRSLPRDYYVHDEKRHALVGKDSGRTFRLADTVMVRLVEADAMRGSTVFELLEGGSQGLPTGNGGSGRPRGRSRHRGGGPKGGGGGGGYRGKRGGGDKKRR